MILLLDTSTGLCKLTFVEGEKQSEYEWQADRTLADNLLGFLEEKCALEGIALQNISGIGVMKGPGSFTGLRIGLAVMNTIASELQVPIVGTTGEDWQHNALERLKNGQNDHLVVPEYGRDANITLPRK